MLSQHKLCVMFSSISVNKARRSFHLTLLDKLFVNTLKSCEKKKSSEEKSCIYAYIYCHVAGISAAAERGELS